MNDLPRIPSRAQTILATLGFLLIASFFLQTEHRAHLYGVLPFLFLLACPLLHRLAHGGHRGHRGHESGSRVPSPGQRSSVDHTGHGASNGGTQ
jgi:hypothetical protein